MAKRCQTCTLTALSMGTTTITHGTVGWVDLRASLKVWVAFQKVRAQVWFAKVMIEVTLFEVQ